MNRKVFTIAAIVAACACCNISAQNCCNNQGHVHASNLGIGPVIAESVNYNALPKDAKDFVNRHFKGETVADVERDFEDNTYEVELANGIDVEFDAKGAWEEIDAGRSRVLKADLVKKLIPERAHRELSRRGVINQVESIKRYADGYKVELKNAKYDDYRFAKDGKLLVVSD